MYPNTEFNYTSSTSGCSLAACNRITLDNLHIDYFTFTPSPWPGTTRNLFVFIGACATTTYLIINYIAMCVGALCVHKFSFYFIFN